LDYLCRGVIRMEINLNSVSPLALVIGVTEVIKRTGKLSHELLPLVNLALGVFFVFLIQGFIFNVDVALQGLVTGLVAGGLYDVGKSSYNMTK